MTVSSQTNTETFHGNGVTTVWDLPFRFFDNADIFVYLIDHVTSIITPLNIGTDYTLTGADLPEQFGTAPGQITTVVAVPTGQDLYVERVMSIEQLTDIVNQGRFFPEVHEDVFDRLTMLIQQNDASGKGAIRVAVTDPEPTRLPIAALRANLLMGFDSLGNPVPVAPVSGSAADLALDLANSSNPDKGAGMVGWKRAKLLAKITTVSQALSSQAVNVWEFADLITSKPNINDPTTWDWSPAVQAAVNFCHLTVPARPMAVSTMCLLKSKINIDRAVDGVNYKENFTIFGLDGGGFKVDTAIPMFSSTLTPVIDPVIGDAMPVTQTVVFRDLNIEGTNPALGAYMLDGNKFVRTWVTGCSITRIKIALTNSYFQSLHFSNNNVRLWEGMLLQANGGAFDVRFNPGNMIEHGQHFLQLISSVSPRAVVGCGVSGCLIEGLSGTGIVYSHVQGFHVTNNYFEQNAGPDIVADSFLATPNRGVTHSGNLHYPTPANAAEPSFWSVRWGATIGGYSAGNFGGTRLNFTQPETQVTLADYSLVAGGVSSSPYKLITQDIAYAIQSPSLNNSVHGNRAWPVGAICYNKDHVTKGFAGWICVTAGTPGEWRPFGTTMDVTGWKFTDENGSTFGEIHTTAPAGGETSLTLLYSNGSIVQLQRVFVGAPDSGGVGFRHLIVPN